MGGIASTGRPVRHNHCEALLRNKTSRSNTPTEVRGRTDRGAARSRLEQSRAVTDSRPAGVLCSRVPPPSPSLAYTMPRVVSRRAALRNCRQLQAELCTPPDADTLGPALHANEVSPLKLNRGPIIGLKLINHAPG